MHKKKDEMRNINTSQEQRLDEPKKNTAETVENESVNTDAVAVNTDAEAIKSEEETTMLNANNNDNSNGKFDAFRRNRNLCLIAAFVVAIAASLLVFCIVGKPVNYDNRSDISLALLDTTAFNRALHGKDSLQIISKGTIRIQKDSTVTLATIQKIKGDSKNAIDAKPNVAPIDIRLSVNTKPAEGMPTEKVISSFELLLFVIFTIVVNTLTYKIIHKSRPSELRYKLVVKDNELVEKTKIEEEQKKQREIKELKSQLSAKDKEIERLNADNDKNVEDSIGSVLSSQKTIDNAPTSIPLEALYSYNGFENLKDKESVLKRIKDLIVSEKKSKDFIDYLNKKLRQDGKISIDNTASIDPYLKTDSGEPKNTKKRDSSILNDLIRRYAQKKVNEIWKNCDEDARKFFDEIANRLKPQQEDPEKYFLNRLKLNGFENIIVDNTTVTSLWDKVKTYFEKSQNGKENELRRQKEQEINSELVTLRKEKKELLEKIISRATKDFDVHLTDAADASSAFDLFCTEFKSMKKDLQIISRLRQMLNLSPDVEIEKGNLRNIINDAVAQKIIEGCHCLEGVEHYDGIKPKLEELEGKLNQAVRKANDAEVFIEDEKKTINEAYKNLFNEDLINDNMKNCFLKFSDKAKESIEALKEDVQRKQDMITNKDHEINEQTEKISGLVSDVNIKEKQIEEYCNNYITRLKKDVSAIKKTVKDNKFLNRTLMDGGFASKLGTIYQKTMNGVESLITKASQLQADENDKPEDILKKVQDLLREELEDASGFINLVAQYYAYSRLPFMSDKNAEYGLQFNRAGIKKIYESVIQLLADFNITLQVPNLFAEYAEDWTYENVTGAGVQKGLDFLIPDAANHIDTVDNSNKEGLIMDFSEIGYTIDGQVEKQTKIIL